MLKPINNHVLIEPLVHKAFVSSQKEAFEEIGIVVDYSGSNSASSSGTLLEINNIKKGCKVFFDSWTAAKYPKEGSNEEFYWLVKYEDIRAVEYAIE